MRPECVAPRTFLYAIRKLYASLQEVPEPGSQCSKPLLSNPGATSQIKLCKVKFVQQKIQLSRCIQHILRAHVSTMEFWVVPVQTSLAYLINSTFTNTLLQPTKPRNQSACEQRVYDAGTDIFSLFTPFPTEEGLKH